MEATSFERFVKAAGDYGASWVFTVGMLGIVLYLAVSVISLGKKWIPLYVQNKMDSDRRIANAVEVLVSQIACIHEVTHGTAEGLGKAVRAALMLGRKATEKWPSDVLLQLKNAAEATEHRNGGKRNYDDDDTQRTA